MRLLLKTYCLLIAGLLFSGHSLTAHALNCETGNEIVHAFDSGAAWQFCVVLDDEHALEIQNLHYQAPGDTSRQVLKQLHLGQILIHQHDATDVAPLIGNNAKSQRLGGHSLVTLNENSCQGELVNNVQQGDKLCNRERPTGLLAKYSKRPGLQGEQYQIFSVSKYQGLNFKIMVGLSEDGRISPSVSLSGQQSQTASNEAFGTKVLNPILNEEIISTSATILYNWRMVFALNGDEANDIVEEFNFTLRPELGSRRPMEVSTLSTETFRNIDRDSFRGWRVRDTDGRGYYLDPQNSGYSYWDNKNNWAQFDLAVTRFNQCEKHSSIKAQRSINEIDPCNATLDQFVNGESMTETNPVLWYSLTRIHRPSAEDFPVIATMISDFDIIPYDWTPTSPFEVIGE